MFFKVEKSGCNVRKGLVEVRYDLYLDEKDYNYSAHYVDMPDIPEGTKYDGKVDEIGTPVDLDDYKKWIDSFPTKKQHNPFCCHFCQFNPDVTDEEILYVGELALDMAYKNWQEDNLLLNKNLAVKFDTIKTADSETRLTSILTTDFTKVTVESEIPYSVK